MPLPKRHCRLSLQLLCIVSLLVAPTVTPTVTPIWAAADPDQDFNCGPFLLQPGPTTMTIVIDHAEPVAARLTWWRAEGGGKHTEKQDAARHHIFPLHDLRADTQYHYRVQAHGFDSGQHSFRTLPEAPEAYRFLALGDVRSRPEDWHRVAERVQQNEPDALFIVGTGDYPADGRQYDQWITQFFDPARAMLARLPFWPAIGNHERTRRYVSQPPPDEVIEEEESHYFNLFDLPGNERWYRVDYQYITLLVIDSNSLMEPGHEQYEWVREQLRSPRNRFTLAAFHHAPLTSGPHGRRLEDGTYREWPLDQIHRFLMPLFEMYGVDLVLNGHDHLYERSQVKGIYYVITGGGGAPLYTVNSADNPYQQVAVSAHHYSAIDVTSTSMALTAIGIDGEILDWFVIPVSTSASARMPRQWSQQLLQTLSFASTPDGASKVQVRNVLSFPVSLSLDNGAGPDRIELAPDAQGDLSLAGNVPDSLLAVPAWRGRVATTARIGLRGSGGGIPLDVNFDQEIVLREASFTAAEIQAPDVDGVLDDWPAAAAMSIDDQSATIVSGEQYHGAADMMARLRVGWSAAGIHLAFAVEDDELVGSESGSPWAMDGVEIYVDGRPEAERVDAYTAAVSQNILPLHRSGVAPEGNNSWREPGAITWSARQRAGGYDLEITIPAESIRADWTPKSGDHIRFDAMINDRDAEGQSHHRLWSTGGANSSTSGYGLLILGN
jgi:hypothetical protein